MPSPTESLGGQAELLVPLARASATPRQDIGRAALAIGLVKTDDVAAALTFATLVYETWEFCHDTRWQRKE
jgi:hypothetical protein